MDYLFNVYLASHLRDKERIAGNIIFEAIKYTRKKKYPDEVENGIQFHKMVYKFMEGSAAFNKSKRKINPRFNRYADSIVMLYYSHFLAKDWEELTGNTLESSVKETFLSLIENLEVVPPKFMELLPLLISNPGLRNLKTVGGLHGFIGELSNKGFCLGYLQYALQDILVDYNSFYEDFKEFIPVLNKFASEFCEEKFPVLAKAS